MDVLTWKESWWDVVYIYRGVLQLQPSDVGGGLGWAKTFKKHKE